MKSKPSSLAAFRKAVLGYYKSNGRSDLPWRKTTDPYKILVSEVMLQQTQVPRVIEKYKSFLKRFPTVRVLARSDLGHVLKEWNGLGYNRRGKYLHDAARAIAGKHAGVFPKDVAELRALPGMGPYTASAVRVFAFDLPDILIETNVRTAYFHHFFKDKKEIRDVDLIPIAAKAADGQDPREWHWALMDYGSYLKRSGIRANAQSKHYVKQSRFEGSLRQVRGEILRQLHEGSRTRSNLVTATGFDLVRIDTALAGLERDGLLKREKGKWRVA
ncbi:MAG: A/G-specific adenine glycosylase [Candidatus Pacebacteria bacterium]|nr:A/G-specific adenine glycosylase [Candidatus Paceibacterota bacterium]